MIRPQGAAEPLVARAPAKVNLALRVLGRRDDGYHELDTVFQSIDLWDTLLAHEGPQLRLTCDDPTIPADATNLVLRAAAALRDRFGLGGRGAVFELRKGIPAQAGLGGGSSDAAAALLLCARLWRVPATAGDLYELAVGLGADVPFFLTGGTARGRGRGDRIEALPPLGEVPLVLGLAPFGTSTAEVFSRLRNRLTLPRNGVSLPIFSGHKWPAENDFGFASNDLESVVFADWPELGAFRRRALAAGARRALLSGSGSTVFGIFEDRSRRDEAAGMLAGEFPGWRVLALSTMQGAAHLVPPVG